MKAIRHDTNSPKPYEHLKPLVELLIDSGNRLARAYRWGENRTGYFCLLVNPIDFALLEGILLFRVMCGLIKQTT